MDPLHAGGDDRGQDLHEANLVRAEAGPRFAAHAAEGAVDPTVGELHRDADIGVELESCLELTDRRLGRGYRGPRSGSRR